ncbi:aldo/keto reductase [Gelidibacter salicanalis]|uniref:Aldo/keto reductase n=1 Tax=Gelidibacter salicanalis TaxID=291193 RepID=A0A5C7ANL9_9FLAO|nr:aldo/keto reductase [Gelidibacter salicanalis]TXE08195.1 aldo/keto reductase [Gelidibacter salicanalis]
MNRSKTKRVKYSKIIAGTMTWGAWGKKLSTEAMADLMHFCVEQGVSTFDHADIYGGYTTEAEFGQAFAQSGLNREAVQLISKCGIQHLSGGRKNKIGHYRYDKDYIIWSVETSLKNLQTEYLDVLLLHRPSPLMHPDEISEAIEKLKQQGKIISFGVSNFTPSQVDLISKNVPVEVNQIEFSLTQYSAMFDGSLDHLLIKEISPMAWSPLGNVFKEDTAQTRRIKILLGELSLKYNATEDALLLAWILKHPANIYPVVGTTTKSRLEDAVKAAAIDLELEDWFLMLVASQGHVMP